MYDLYTVYKNVFATATCMHFVRKRLKNENDPHAICMCATYMKTTTDMMGLDGPICANKPVRQLITHMLLIRSNKSGILVFRNLQNKHMTVFILLN